MWESVNRSGEGNERLSLSQLSVTSQSSWAILKSNFKCSNNRQEGIESLPSKTINQLASPATRQKLQAVSRPDRRWARKKKKNNKKNPKRQITLWNTARRQKFNGLAADTFKKVEWQEHNTPLSCMTWTCLNMDATAALWSSLLCHESDAYTSFNTENESRWDVFVYSSNTYKSPTTEFE